MWDTIQSCQKWYNGVYSPDWSQRDTLFWPLPRESGLEIHLKGFLYFFISRLWKKKKGLFTSLIPYYCHSDANQVPVELHFLVPSWHIWNGWRCPLFHSLAEVVTHFSQWLSKRALTAFPVFWVGTFNWGTHWMSRQQWLGIGEVNHFFPPPDSPFNIYIGSFPGVYVKHAWETQCEHTLTKPRVDYYSGR